MWAWNNNQELAQNLGFGYTQADIWKTTRQGNWKINTQQQPLDYSNQQIKNTGKKLLKNSKLQKAV